MSVVILDNIASEFGEIMKKLSGKNQRLIGSKVASLPDAIKRDVLSFYFTVLKVRTGRLRQSFQEFARQAGAGVWEIGMKSEVEYAHIQHEGGKTPPHIIVPKRTGKVGFLFRRESASEDKKALFWPGAAHPVRKVNHPGSVIKAKKFFSKPMEYRARIFIDELKKEIGF